MKKVLIKNSRLVLEDNILEGGMLVIEDGIIRYAGKSFAVKAASYTEIIDAENCLVGPGFIDIHCHGGDGCCVEEDLQKVLSFHLKHGTTGMLAAIAYNVDMEQAMNCISEVKKLQESCYDCPCIGIHMEGPYINSKYGAESAFARPFDREEYNLLLKHASSVIKVWTFAPELEGAGHFAEAIAENGIIPSIGHSEADESIINAMVKKGLKLACHIMNATGTTPSPPEYGGTREVGVDEAVMANDDIYAEVIPDRNGIHVRPTMLKLLHKAKGADGIIIITDAVRFSGFNGSGESDVNFNFKGQLAGSRLTMNSAVRNMMNHTGIGIVEAFRMASLNPAVLLGIDNEVGSLKEGKKGDAVIVSENLEVKKVIFRGRIL